MIILAGVISPVAAWVMPRHYVDRLRQQFPEHEFLEGWSAEEVRRLLPQADVAFTPYVPRKAFAEFTRLKWVQAPASGVDFLLYPEMIDSPIVITSARGVRARAIAEYVMAAVFSLARRLPMAMRAQVAHEWVQDAIEESRAITLLGARAGIVGLGAIGVEVAKMAAGVGMRVTATRRRTDEPLPAGVERVLPPDRLPELLSAADVVVLSVPHTTGTHSLIGAPELAMMKRGALLVNIARGKLLDDAAIVAALRSGQLGGAALDVFPKEPLDPESPYWDFPNVIVTPHSAGAMEDYWTPLCELFADNLRRFADGRPLLNVVDKHAGY